MPTNTDVLSRVFQSRLERNVALAILIALIVPSSLITYFAIDQIVRETTRQSEQRLRDAAKDYGMVLMSRLEQYEDLLEKGVDTNVPVTATRSTLTMPGNDSLSFTRGQSSVEVGLNEWLADVTYSEFVRCVSVPLAQKCDQNAKADHLISRWTLRPVGQFETDLEFTVVVQQPMSEALSSVALSTRLLPLFVALFTSVLAMWAVLYVRSRMAPVKQLKSTLKRLEHGEYGTQVEIESRDEFALLGRALNDLSEKLDDSFKYNSDLNSIDGMVLNAVPLDEIAEAVCMAVLEHTPVPWAAIRKATTGELLNICDPVATQVQTTKLEIINEDRVWGTFEYVGEAHERVEELLRKFSVAVNHHTRAERLFQQATYDSLTGLLNRAAFNAELTRAIERSRRSKHIHALVFLDLDNFKLINDTQGHGVGDKLLHVIGKRLEMAVREGDIVARLGGDEFAILCAGADDEISLIRFIDRILEAICKPISTGEGPESLVTGSAGISILHQDGRKPEELTRKADLAMYEAKTIAGSSYRFYNPEHNAGVERRVQVETRLRQAVQQEKLQIALQAKQNLSTHTIDSFECLARWHDEELGWVNPQYFITVAEQCGLIHEVTELVFKQLAEVLKDPRAEGIRLAINISPVHLSQIGFFSWFSAMIEYTGVSPDQLEVEITESLLIEQNETVLSTIRALQDVGVVVSLDDFGTGYSSLSVIANLGLDALKLDKSFIDRLGSDGRATLLIEKLIEIGQGLGLKTVAEGVETAAQLELLQKLGCTYAQGYYISKPVMPEEALKLLEDSNQQQVLAG